MSPRVLAFVAALWARGVDEVLIVRLGNGAVRVTFPDRFGAEVDVWSPAIESHDPDALVALCLP